MNQALLAGARDVLTSRAAERSVVLCDPSQGSFVPQSARFARACPERHASKLKCKFTKSYLFVLALALPSRVAAQHFTLEGAVSHALSRSPRVQSASAARATALAYRRFAEVPRAGNPSLGVRAMIGRPDSPAATYALTLGLPFDVSGKRRAWRSEARFMLNEADALLAATQNDVRAETRGAYADVAIAQSARSLAEESVSTARELLERVRTRVAASASTALDLTLAESQAAEAEADLEHARRALVEAQARFRQLLDLSGVAAVELAPLPPPASPLGLSLPAAIERAKQARNEPRAYGSARDRHRASDRRLRAEALGPMTAALEAERQGNDNANSSVGASVAVELPFIQRNRGERAVAARKADAAALEHDLSERAIEREVSASFQRREAALRELATLDERAIPAAERTLEYVRKLLDSGAIDYFRVLSARKTAYALRMRRIDALREAWSCQVALERALGGGEKTP